MKQLRVLSAVGLLALAGAAQADVTSTVTLVSDYDFRGFTQTGESPAVQLSLDFATEGGFYAGLWGSNVDDFCDTPDGCYDDEDNRIFNTASTEVDAYAGFKLPLGDSTLDLGAVYYTYAGASDLNFAEIYGKFSWKILAAGVFYSNDFGGKFTGDTSDAAAYAFADVNIPAGPLTIGLHAGMSTGDGIEAAYFPAEIDDTVTPAVVLTEAEDTYTDYALSLSYSASNFTTSIKWVALDAGDRGSDDRILLSVSTTLPWAE
jgi:uncharacterized protein (TIGR02001 family)